MNLKLITTHLIYPPHADLNSIEDARKLAIDIFVALCKDGRTRLFVDDFYPAFPTKDEAQRAFAVFDRSECGDISRLRSALYNCACSSFLSHWAFFLHH